MVGDGFQRGPDNVLAVAAAGQPHDGAAGVHIPVGGAKPGKGRHNVDAAVILQPVGKVLAVRGLLDQVQFIPDPLNDRTADEYAALQGIAGATVGAGGHGGHQPVLALEKVAAGVHQQKAAGAVGVFGLTGLKAGLPEQRCLLVAGAAGNGDFHAGVVHGAVHFTGGAHLRQHIHGDLQRIADGLIPAHMADIVQHGAGGVGVIGDVHPPAGQLPDQPAIHGAEQQAALRRHLAGVGDVIQDPLDLGAGKIGVDQQAGMLPDIRLQPLSLQFLADWGGAAALPYDGVINGAAGLLIPHDGGFPLVGDADGGDLLRRNVAFGQHLHHNAVLGGIDLHRIMLHIAGFGVMLGKFLLPHGDDVLLPVEQNGAGTGRSLVKRDDVLLHGRASFMPVSNCPTL